MYSFVVKDDDSSKVDEVILSRLKNEYIDKGGELYLQVKKFDEYYKIGYGHIIRPGDSFNEFSTISKKQAEILFKEDYGKLKNELIQILKFKEIEYKELHNGAKNAMIDLFYLCGIRILTFVKTFEFLKGKDYEKAAERFTTCRIANFAEPKRLYFSSVMMRTGECYSISSEKMYTDNSFLKELKWTPGYSREIYSILEDMYEKRINENNPLLQSVQFDTFNDSEFLSYQDGGLQNYSFSVDSELNENSIISNSTSASISFDYTLEKISYMSTNFIRYTTTGWILFKILLIKTENINKIIRDLYFILKEVNEKEFNLYSLHQSCLEYAKMLKIVPGNPGNKYNYETKK